MSPFYEEVQRGGRWLDKHYPDWLWKVNDEKLDMESAERCVLAQVDDYWALRATYDLAWMAAGGFHLGEYDMEDNTLEYVEARAATWRRLTEEWRVYIRYRRWMRKEFGADDESEVPREPPERWLRYLHGRWRFLFRGTLDYWPAYKALAYKASEPA